MKKTLLIATVALLAFAGLAFASGANEKAPSNPLFQGEKLTLSGKVSLQNTVHPVLTTADKKTYNLLVPRFLYAQVSVKEGDEVKVEGYKTFGPRWETNPDAVYVAVTKATIGGKDYDLSNFYNNAQGPWGGRGGMMGGRAWRGYGPQGYGRYCW